MDGYLYDSTNERTNDGVPSVSYERIPDISSQALLPYASEMLDDLQHFETDPKCVSVYGLHTRKARHPLPISLSLSLFPSQTVPLYLSLSE